MRFRTSLVDVLKFGRHATPGFGISKSYYLSILAARAPLPSLTQILSPNPTDGAIAGYGVPLSKGATKNCLQQPIERGAYALAAPDRKTVLRLMVLSKEEAGYCPSSCARMASEVALSPEARDRMLSTWTLMQLTIESHHPMVYPAIRFMLSAAARMAYLTEGLVADPMSRVYRLPEKVGQGSNDQRMSVTDVVCVHHRLSSDGVTLVTLGLLKFAMPELSMKSIDPSLALIAENALYATAQAMLDGEKVHVGDRVGPIDSSLILVESSLAEPGGLEVPCLLLTSDGARSVNEILVAWSAEALSIDEQAARL